LAEKLITNNAVSFVFNQSNITVSFKPHFTLDLSSPLFSR